MPAHDPQQQQQAAPSTEAEDDLAVQQQLLHPDQQQQQDGAGNHLGPHEPLQHETSYPQPIVDVAQHHLPSFGDDESAQHHEHADSILEAHLNSHLDDEEGGGRPADDHVLDPSLATDHSTGGGGGGGDTRDASQEHHDADGNLHGHELGGAQLAVDGINGGIAAPKTRKRKGKDGEEAKPVKASLTAGDWMRVFQFLDDHPELSQLKICHHFRDLEQDALSFNQATLSRTMRKREQITKLFQSGPQGPQLKRQRKVKYPEVENALLAWIAERKAAGDMPGGKEIKQKVVTLQTDLGMDLNEGGGLKGTNGWLESFIHTHNLLLPPTASSEAKRAKRALIAGRNKQRAGGSDGGSPGLNASQSPHPGLAGLGQQSLDSANSHHVMDSYLETDPASYGLHGHDGNEGMMEDVEGFVLALPPQEQHEFQQPTASGGDQQPSMDRPSNGEHSQSNIDPAFQLASSGPSGSGPQRQPATASTKYESWVGQVEALERMLDTDRAEFLASCEQDLADAFEPADTAADLLKALGRLRTYLAAHHQHH